MASESTASSNRFQIVETNTFDKRLNRIANHERIYSRIKNYIYPFLRENPFFGPNIKRLKGEFSEFYRIRIGDYRLFYTIDEAARRVYVVTISHRQDAYKDVP